MKPNLCAFVSNGMRFTSWTLLTGTVLLGALALATPGGAYGFGACCSTDSANPPVAATARASTAPDAGAPVKGVAEDEPAAGVEVLNPTQARRALALAILLGGNARHDSTNY